ncbi:MAG: TIGR02281 family clan AA aspartic protease [Burkholderiales bacterium]|nr:TIGR02281 family clan AA aspartic protease [Burkholderiales bacterium]
MRYGNTTAWIAALWLLTGAVHAADITVTALFGGKAQIAVDGGRPVMLSTGQTSPEGVRLISADSGSAVVEYRGRRLTLAPGAGSRIGGGPLPAGAGSDAVTLTPDSRGHFMTLGQVNGGTVQFLVDTGATLIALPSSEARRLGISYLGGPRGYTETANGKAIAYRIKLDSVKIGDITLYGVDAMVMEGDGLKVALLGMSFLNRTEMRRDGQTLTLIKRF